MPPIEKPAVTPKGYEKEPSGSREERLADVQEQIDELCKQREAIMNEPVK
jgi:hypothetical protein